MSDLSVAIRVREPTGVPRRREAIRVGVPLGRGQVADAAALALVDELRRPIAWQGKTLAHWPDGSVKWLLVDALLDIEGDATQTLRLERGGPGEPGAASSKDVLVVSSDVTGLSLSTGSTHFQFIDGAEPFRCALGPGAEPDLSAGIRLTRADNTSVLASFEPASLVESGPLRATVSATGHIRDPRGRPWLRCEVRAAVLAGSNALELEITLWNPAAAFHPGGVWDLGDPGSALFRDLSLEISLARPVNHLLWRTEPDQPLQQGAGIRQLSIYQDSSGGPNWNAPNHVDRHGDLTVRFPGYRVSRLDHGDPSPREIKHGLRATPFLALADGDWQVVIEVTDFWQNFPKSLRFAEDQLAAGLFPNESGQLYELQGGERKRHRLVLKLDDGNSPLRSSSPPLEVALDPEAVERSGAIPWFNVTGAEQLQQDYVDYIAGIVDGPNSFFAKREHADEYGWRNYGELHADHEAIHHRGDRPFVSHYNNQYDFIQGAFLHFQRTADPRWRELMADLARHVIDIDVYRTSDDKPAFNGGLFWHTDHYLDAATCTHRTYSRSNGGTGYGGGPSSEHNYTTGLLYYFYLTGDEDAANTVRLLADWVCAMDDGACNPLALFDEGPTGAATSGTKGSIPGRAAGNSINALVDAYLLTRRRSYLDTAEAFIRRCIHPGDDVAAHGFDEPELTWSYLVFLQALGKYLEFKVEFGELDYMFHYARASLLRYADWMQVHEVPYRDILDKVEIPTETWPAHDIRKCHVFHLAARHTDGPQRERYAERAQWFYQRCLDDLRAFPTSNLTRPLAILAVYGGVHGYFLRQQAPLNYDRRHSYDFGEPVPFVPQRARAKASLKRKLRLLAQELRRQTRQRMGALRARLGG